MIRTIIADDEPLAREKLRTLLEGESDIKIIGECVDGLETVNSIKNDNPDLLFLDVQMPELDGLGVLHALNGVKMPTIIFVTAFDRYALKAFEVNALDYLLKPFDRERFQQALQRARRHVRKEKSGEVNEKLLALLEHFQEGKHNTAAQEFLERLVIKTGGRVIFLKTHEIDWIEAAGNYVRLYVGKDSHLLRETMTKIETKLDPSHFLRIHRSAIVRIDRIRALQPWFHGEYVVTLQSGKQLTSSRSYRHNLSALLKNSF
ncbi:MAG: LytR/AlgR family response regulator transcription factor [bacterium]